ncbi:HelD family protein [Streptomyces albipurpureus]|uniref:AAA family ATPase n=1 Tax=Streptomyces albipurpureus TaxID=2897419 RepID=A0ABT0UZ82_9ACTN|nr:AAA family ATPase [Streptomyces sp. CWNU-1]MCM2393410.1 AAA family ATPase [Streptomyces sp. CWNU-1]
MTDPNAPISDFSEALGRERAYHDRCRAAQNAMSESAQEQVIIGEHASASGPDAEVLGHQLRTRAKELRELPPGPLFFGRLNFHQDATAAGEHAGQSYHIGRLRITRRPSDPPLVIDWRAPISRVFYQANPGDPQGVTIRRRYGWLPASRGDSADLTGLEDEHLHAGDTRESAIVAGEIGRPRIGPMRDIAATIQPEQDDLVREEFTASLCVQGAPGTGKTAVGLHRAAYLLYAFPQRIQRGGMLVLGPSQTFLTYVSQVLPALGEGEVRQSTVEDEIARHPVRAQDPRATAIVKHDARMAEVLRRTLYARVRPECADALVLPDGSYRWRIPPDVLARTVRDVLAEEPPYAMGRERVRTRVVHLVQQQAERRAGPRPNSWAQKVARARPLTALLHTVWPNAQAEQVLTELLGSPEALALAATGVLDSGERKALLWADPPRSPASARWSAADLVLLDELAGLMERPPGYGHIVIDEAQDLSPMECRVIARRSPFGSLTVLGDLAQGTTPWAARDWPRLLTHLGKAETPVISLTTGFRLPQAIATLTNHLLTQLNVPVPPARSLRRDGEVHIERTGNPTAATITAVRAALIHDGSIGVIAADTEVGALRDALAGAGIPASGPDTPQARVSVVPASAAKGLEYDHVVAVEPAAIVHAEPRGLHRLYVVLTRAVSRLHVIHSQPLPFTLPTEA